jgi:predicted outer membrane repeat protein
MSRVLSRMAEVLGFTSRLTTNRLRSRSGFKLRVEGLEAREVPAFLVTDPGDSGPGTLRQAIIDAQDILADNDEIVIAESVGEIILSSPLPTLVETHTIRAEFTGPTAAHVLITPEAGLENTFRCMRVIPNGVTLTLWNIDFDSFGAVSDGFIGSGDGGAISADGQLDLAYCNFTDCTATGNGGAIALGRSLTLNTCLFLYNAAGGNGGAIWEVSTSVPYWQINDSFFGGNSAGGSGGAIYLHTSSAAQLICRETPFQGNTAGGNGGAIYQMGGFLDVTDASSMGSPGGFIGNQAGGVGGAIYIYDATNVYFDAYTNGNLDQVTGSGYPRPNALFIAAPRPGILFYINYDRITDGVIIEE